MYNFKKYIINNKYVILIFTIFFVLVFIQHQSLYLYHDDYGYASLSYAYKMPDVNGCDFNLSQLIRYLIEHYKIWGGRIVGFFFEIVFLSKGIWLYRLLQSIVITLIFFLIYKIVKKTIPNNSINDSILALIAVSLYGVFDIMVVRSGIFWISASILYVFPIAPLLGFIYLYNDKKNKVFKSKFTSILFYIFNGVFIFLATFSQEQIAIAALSYIMILTIYNSIKNKKLSKADILMCVISLISFFILMLAPGNKIRQLHPTSASFYELPILKRIAQGFENLILGEFISYTRVFAVLFIFSVVYVTIVNIKNKNSKKIIRILDMISVFSTLFVFVVTLFKNNGYFEYMFYLINSGIYRKIIVFIFIIQLGLMIYSVIIYLYTNNKLKLANIIISAVCSQGCMIVAPYFALRSAIIFQVLCFIFILYIMNEIYISLKSKNIFRYTIISLVVLLSINFIKITVGYYKNININKYNDIKLTEVSTKIKNGEKINSVLLKKLPDILYSGEQPYIDGCDYIKPYIREYYNLPENFEINYE